MLHVLDLITLITSILISSLTYFLKWKCNEKFYRVQKHFFYVLLDACSFLVWSFVNTFQNGFRINNLSGRIVQVRKEYRIDFFLSF
jgi:hypothetical protein